MSKSLLNTSNPPVAQLKIKLYSDGADLAQMLEMAANPQVSGITTNPSLMKKAGITDYRTYAKEVLSQVRDKPISFEVFADDFTEMAKQAKDIRSWGKNVYVKIPITNSRGESSLPLIRELSHEQTQLNVTAIFTLDQVQDTCEAVRGGAPSIVSIFAGRIADSGRDPMPLMKAAADICRSAGDSIELLWASTREVYNIFQAQDCQCQIITVPPELLKKLSGLGRDLNDLSLDTVKAFKKDSDAAGFKL